LQPLLPANARGKAAGERALYVAGERALYKVDFSSAQAAMAFGYAFFDIVLTSILLDSAFEQWYH